MEDVVIVAAVRTPVGKFQGALSLLTAVQLGAIVVREAVRRVGLEPALFGPAQVDECIMGNVLSWAEGRSFCAHHQ